MLFDPAASCRARVVLPHWRGPSRSSAGPVRCRPTINLASATIKMANSLKGRFRAFWLGFNPLRDDSGPYWRVQLVGDRGRWGIEEVFPVTEYLPYARSTHQRSPDEAVHEVPIDCK